MVDYLQQILGDKYQEICYLRQEMLYGQRAMQREDCKRGFLVKCQEIEDLIKEINTKEHRGAHIRRGVKPSVIKVTQVTDTEQRIKDIRHYL